MKGITFNGQHSADWGLILTHFAANSPTVKKTTVEIAGRDGVLDLTDYFGGVKYDNRQLECSFMLPNIPAHEFINTLSAIKDKLHGQIVRVEPDDDPDYYYEGRAEVEGEQNKATGTIKITVDAKPYKLRKTPTIENLSVSGTQQITLENSRREVVPMITTSAAMTIVFDEITWSVSAGTFQLPDLILKEGSNAITITGDGDISFEYREGCL